MKKLFVIVLRPGPIWEPDANNRQQPFWNQYTIYTDKLFAQGKLLMAGQFADHSGIQLLMRAESVTEIRDWLQVDPFVLNGVCVLESINEWNLFLNVYQND